MGWREEEGGEGGDYKLYIGFAHVELYIDFDNLLVES